MAPTAYPAKPTPSVASRSTASTGTSFAHGLPRRSTNSARMNFVPDCSARVASSDMVLQSNEGPAGAGEWFRAGRSSSGGLKFVRGVPVELRVDALFLFVGRDANAHRLLDDEGDEVRHHERVRHHCAGGDRLLPQLIEPAAVEQAVGLVRHACTGEEPDQQGAD